METEDMNPHEVRAALIKIVRDSAAVLSVEDWKDGGPASVTSCAIGTVNGIKYEYIYGAPQPGGDHLADAKKISRYWKSLGMSARVDTRVRIVAYGSGANLQRITFNTGPGNYYIAATSLCVPGNAHKLEGEELSE